MDPNENIKLLSKEATAKMLSLSVRTVERMIGSGELPTIKLGKKRVLISQRDVEVLIASRRGGPNV